MYHYAVCTNGQWSVGSYREELPLRWLFSSPAHALSGPFPTIEEAQAEADTLVSAEAWSERRHYRFPSMH